MDERFVKEEPDIGKGFDLICGTSTGSILACALAVGVPLHRVCDLYRKNGASIFPSPMPKSDSRLAMGLWILKHSLRPSASSSRLRACLAEVLGDQTIGEVYKSRGIALCIPTVDALNHQAWVFKTPHFPEKHRDNNYRLVDICMASSAAPIFFALSQQSNPDNVQDIHYFVDGGLWANNPVLVGLIEALTLVRREREIEVISVGTCDRPSGDPNAVQNPNWGLLRWKAGVNALDMSLSSQSFGDSFMAQFIAKTLSECGPRVSVVRFEEGHKSPQQYSAIGLDRADKVALDTLVSLAEKDAARVHSKTLSAESGSAAILTEIFHELPVLTTD
jgi:predicted acylesterase/phospholipase RssA